MGFIHSINFYWVPLWCRAPEGQLKATGLLAVQSSWFEGAGTRSRLAAAGHGDAGSLAGCLGPGSAQMKGWRIHSLLDTSKGHKRAQELPPRREGVRGGEVQVSEEGRNKENEGSLQGKVVTSDLVSTCVL